MNAIASLQAAYEAARDAARANSTPETRAAVVASSAALSAALVASGKLPKAARSRDMSPAARSGRRQHAEQRARTAEALARAARRG